MPQPPRTIYRLAPWDFALAFTLSVLWFLPLLKILLVGSQDPGSLHGVQLDPVYFRAVILSVVTMATLLAAWAYGVRKVDRKLIYGTAAVGLLVSVFLLFRRLRKYGVLPIGYMADWFSPYIGVVPFALLAISIFALVAVLTVRRFWRVARLVRIGVLFLFPFALMQLAQLAYHAWPDSGVPTARASTGLQTAKGPRVILLVFDELDSRALYEHRPPWLKTPNLDALATESFVATHAISPGGNTDISIPGMLSGAVVTRVIRPDRTTLLVAFRDSSGVRSWQEQPHLFEQLEAAGIRVGVVGWYQPYCRDLARNTTRCWTYTPTPLPTETIGLARMTAAVVRVNWRLDRAFKERPADRYEGLRHQALAMVADKHLDLVFAHFSIPHAPYLRESNGSGYFGGVELVDELVGDVRRQLKLSKEWDNAVVIVTADHGTGNIWGSDTAVTLRSRSVPFIIKLPHKRTSYLYENEFGTELLAKLVPELARGSIRDYNAMAKLLGH